MSLALKCLLIATIVGGLVATVCSQETLTVSPLVTVGVTPPTSTLTSMTNNILDTTGNTLTIASMTAVTARVNNAAQTSCNLQSYGEFTGGTSATGNLLRQANQNAVGTATYAGGIGIPTGAVMSTGIALDYRQPPFTPPAERGFGIEGPNNGIDSINAALPEHHDGESSTQMVAPGNGQDGTIDIDFDAAVFKGAMTNPGPTETSLIFSGDPTVLQFTIQLAKPAFVRTTWVFATDEAPAWLNQDYNDSFAILCKSTRPSSIYQNLAVFRSPSQSAPMPFTLAAIQNCGPRFFKKNQLAPNPGDFTNSLHRHVTPELYYDHEFGGFTKPMTSETAKALAPGRYVFKFVVQDVADRKVDAALFIQQDSLKAYTFAAGDYNLDGTVDAADYTVWRDNLGAVNPSFQEGDGNGDGDVTLSDWTIWKNSFGQTGQANRRADFNRDGQVNQADVLIHQQFRNPDVGSCANRFEGDANGDGAVNAADEAILIQELSGGGAAMSASSGGSTAAGIIAAASTLGAAMKVETEFVIEQGEKLLGSLAPTAVSANDLPDSPDVDGDGDFDDEDDQRILQILAGFLTQ